MNIVTELGIEHRIAYGVSNRVFEALRPKAVNFDDFKFGTIYLEFVRDRASGDCIVVLNDTYDSSTIQGLSGAEHYGDSWYCVVVI